MKRFCPKCGTGINPGDKYCSDCGRKLNDKRLKGGKNPNRIYIGGTVVAVLILVTVIVLLIGVNKKTSVNRAYNTAQIGSVAAAFDCSCGQCDKKLVDCDCPTAKETYAFISDAVGKSRYSRNEIIEMVNRRYGHLIGDSNTIQG